jgi:preprotein translocase subunit SecY
MFEKAINVFKVDELRKKIVVTLTFLFVYRLGYQVPLPGIALGRIQRIWQDIQEQGGGDAPLGGLLNLVSILSAGDVLSFGIFSLGIMPYISSSIIFSILAKVVPSIEQMVKEGSQGQKRLNQWMRWGTVPICLLQGIFVLEGVILNPENVNIGRPPRSTRASSPGSSSASTCPRCSR